MESAEEAVTWWKGSDAHWDMLMSTQTPTTTSRSGVARANNGWYFWTAIVFVGPDRTPPKASMDDANARKVAGGSHGDGQLDRPGRSALHVGRPACAISGCRDATVRATG